MTYNFAVFILSHGRANKVITYNTLRKHGYTGKIYIVIDDEDKMANEYKLKFGNDVVIFSKKDYQSKFDVMDNFDNNKVVVYARNACYDIARKLKLDYFFEYEDDYTAFQYKYIENETLKAKQIRNLDIIFELMIRALNDTSADTLAFSQGGDHMGGAEGFHRIQYKRKAMNSFIFKVNENPDKDISFIGRMNDDVNTYLINGKTGKLFFQNAQISVVQLITQSNSGGNTEAYKDSGTYVKSFYSVMSSPSCCKIRLMGSTNRRIHHHIKWNDAVPKILSEQLKKQ